MSWPDDKSNHRGADVMVGNSTVSIKNISCFFTFKGKGNGLHIINPKEFGRLENRESVMFSLVAKILTLLLAYFLLW